VRAVAKVEVVLLESGDTALKVEGQVSSVVLVGMLEQAKAAVLQKVSAPKSPVAAAPPGFLNGRG
jgi:hypothetical protein